MPPTGKGLISLHDAVLPTKLESNRTDLVVFQVEIGQEGTVLDAIPQRKFEIAPNSCASRLDLAGPLLCDEPQDEPPGRRSRTRSNLKSLSWRILIGLTKHSRIPAIY